MFFEQIYDKTLSQASYLIGCQQTKEAIVIDPKRDVDTYIQLAKENNLRITKVTETHIHADFLSGSRELVALCGAELYLSDQGGKDWQYEFQHVGLKHGQLLQLGNLTLEVLHTPGHTPESLSFLLTDHAATDKPVMIFTGDFVFVGDVGRPDLLEEAVGVLGSKVEGARQLFESLRLFKSLPDYVQVWPGHGAGSPCGKAIGAVASSTVGYEKIRNWALQHERVDSFIEELLENQPEVPHYFAKMKILNKIDRPLLPVVPNYPQLSLQDVSQGDILVDTRNKVAFSKAHYTGAINIQNNRSLATWAGWMLPYDKDLVILTDLKDKQDITRKLMRIGMDNIKGFILLEGDEEYMDSLELVDAKGVEKELEQGKSILLDVRNSREFTSGHIAGAQHYFVGKMASSLPAIDKQTSLIIQCQSGDRASIAASYLKHHGFTDVKSYIGSMADWKEKGLAIEK